MLKPLKIFFVTALAILLAGRPADAQSNMLRLDGGGAHGLTGVVTNGSVTISWPVLPDAWQLMEQKPAFKAEWKPVSGGRYQTNAFGVSLTLPLSSQPALYRLGRAMAHSPGAILPMPPMPPMPTNRPPMPKFPGQP